MQTKACYKCGEILPLTDYYRKKRSADGHSCYCKDCDKKRMREYRERNVERLRAYDNNRHNKAERIRKNNIRLANRSDLPDDYHMAHSKVKYAIKTGKLLRPRICEVCGCECKPEAHHVDYDRPLDVVWLCPPCHKKLHNGKGEAVALLLETVVSIWFCKLSEGARAPEKQAEVISVQTIRTEVVQIALESSCGRETNGAT